MAEHCEPHCDLPEFAPIDARATCGTCGLKYIVTDRWKAVGPMWEPVSAVESWPVQSADGEKR